MLKWHEPSDHPYFPDGFHSPPLFMEIQYPDDVAHYRTGHAVKCGEDGEDSVIYLTDDDLCVQGYAMKRWAYTHDVLEAVDVIRCATWEETEVDGWYACSHCGEDTDHRTNYCPRCGTVMEW